MEPQEREEEKDEEDFFDPSDSPRERSGPNPYVIPMAILIAGALIAGSVVYTSSGTRSPDTRNTAAVGKSAPVDVKTIAGDAPFLGKPDAPVSVVEFGDFQCPFCGRFFKTTEREIIEKYVKTGKVKFAYRSFAFLGPESEWAAEAAACANTEGKFWQYHDYLYTHQNGENQGAFTKDNLKHFALQLGLDAARFNACLDQDTFLAAVKKDTEDGRALGVDGTPTTFINGRILAGAVPFAQFASVIDEELQKAK